MLMMICLKESDEYIYASVEEYYRVVEALNYVGVEHTDYIVEDKIYRITWYDEIDDEWKDIWCEEDTYETNLALVNEACVEYNVVEYN